jgi:hypothetical protein
MTDRGNTNEGTKVNGLRVQAARQRLKAAEADYRGALEAGKAHRHNAQLIDDEIKAFQQLLQGRTPAYENPHRDDAYGAALGGK